jgi:peptide/nickel transport system permease protein
VLTQFGQYLLGLAQGDLLVSVRYGRPVLDVLAERIGWTLLLVGSAVVLATLIGTFLGFRSARRWGSAGDTGVLSGVMFVDALPPFLIGMLLLLVFSVELGWLPTFGAQPTTAAGGVPCSSRSPNGWCCRS